MNRSIILGIASALFTFATAQAAEPPASRPAVVLKSEALRISIDPAFGARASEFRSLKQNYNFVQRWKWTESAREGNLYQGGIFGGLIDGSYRSEQLKSPYKVLEQSDRSVTLQYEMDAPLLSGLRETRTISLDESGNGAVVKIVVANTSDEPRTINYRFQDWLGTGARHGRDSVCILPGKEALPDAFMLGRTGKAMEHFDLDPQQSWYAMEDLPADIGLLVRVSDSRPKGVYFWSGAEVDSRAGELFLPRQTLAPKQQWEVTVHYRVFTPSAPDTGDKKADALLKREVVETALQSQTASPMRPLPYDAQLTLPNENSPVSIVPVGATDEKELYESSSNDAAPMTLAKISLAGTPGEMVPFAFRIRARKAISGGTVSLDELKSKDGAIGRQAFDPRFVTAKGNYLVHDWTLAEKSPDELATINNNLHDADHLTPFSLTENQGGLIWVYLRVPKDAKAGVYHGRCAVKAGEESAAFDIQLTVWPFALQRPTDKHYGSFFRYYLPGDKNPKLEQPQPGLVSREAYRAALEQLNDVGYDSMMIYVHTHDDLQWVLDQCVDLGWTHGTFVLASPAMTPEELKKRYGQYNMTFLAWGVDEPTREKQIKTVISRYEGLLKRGYTPVFTPNVPLGLIIADSLKKIVPIIALSGNAPYAFDVTKRYCDEGRQVYWYNTGLGRPSLSIRLTRGIYFWKEPVNGIIDWGEDAAAPHVSDHQAAGFVGDRTVPTLGRENVRQALYDLAYLNTLSQHIKTSKNKQAIADGKALLQWIDQQFGDDWHAAARRIDGPEYLTALRQKISDCIVQLDRGASTGDQN